MTRRLGVTIAAAVHCGAWFSLPYDPLATYGTTHPRPITYASRRPVGNGATAYGQLMIAHQKSLSGEFSSGRWEKKYSTYTRYPCSPIEKKRNSFTAG